jgi:hypothetical protein
MSDNAADRMQRFLLERQTTNQILRQMRKISEALDRDEEGPAAPVKPPSSPAVEAGPKKP